MPAGPVGARRALPRGLPGRPRPRLGGHRPDLRRVPAPRGAGRAAALGGIPPPLPRARRRAQAPDRAPPRDGRRPRPGRRPVRDSDDAGRGERLRPSGRPRGVSQHPRLRDPGRPGPGWHGDRLSRPADRVEAPRGREDAHRRRAGQPRGRGAVPGRGRGHGPAAAPEHRPDLRRGPARRGALPGARAGRGPLAGPGPGRHAAAGRVVGADDGGAGAGDPRGAPARVSCTATCRRPTS